MVHVAREDSISQVLTEEFLFPLSIQLCSFHVHGLLDPWHFCPHTVAVPDPITQTVVHIHSWW
jgi:hypothetical protein